MNELICLSLRSNNPAWKQPGVGNSGVFLQDLTESGGRKIQPGQVFSFEQQVLEYNINRGLQDFHWLIETLV
jgi:hypothetical protein